MNVHVQQIRSYIDQNFADLIDLSDCSSAQEKQAKLLGRGITALALMHLCDITKQEAAAAVTDGSDDNGIDGIAVSASGDRVYLVQSKWNDSGTKTIEVGDVHKFLQGCKDIVASDRWSKFNQRIQQQSSKLEAALQIPTVQVHLVVTYPSVAAMSAHCSELIQAYLTENNNPTTIFFSQTVGLSGLKSVITQQITGNTGDVQAALFEWGMVKEPYDAVYGQVACSDVAKWFVDHGAKLFAPNIRSFLGDTNVNAGIIKSLATSPETFWYVNNGITAICESFSKTALGGSTRDSGTFTFKNLRIVNGAQTVGAISDFAKSASENVEKARVAIKVISTRYSPMDFEAEVTTKTNTQNRVEARDFASLDPNQARLRQELFSAGIEYVYRAGEKYGDPSSGFDLQEAATALACSSADVGYAVLAKRNIGLLLDREGIDYKKLFVDELKGLDLWKHVKAQRAVDAELMKRKASASGRMAQLLVHGNRVLSHLILNSPSVIIDGQADQVKLEAALDAVVPRAKEFIDSNYPESYLAVYFKNTEKCAELKASVSS